MNIIEKIAKEETYNVVKMYKRYASCRGFHKVTSARIPGATDEETEYHPLVRFLVHGEYSSIETKEKVLLKFELKSLWDYRIITYKEYRKFSKMINADQSMRGLAGVVINQWRNKRIRKYGYGNVKL